ncbi:PepSY-associated TM helix domain-containing protein [Sphingomonas sp. BK235]|uniref:PepSY-associated TM helix domain-containing protein n=1 Tax=Sphingomonas sp. BK235 TaxID=2512131 RepID=UPI00104D38DD|nr:PepSY-associated TM helix domain-containing protein [Sphingomonas sp. BK235]TCP34225.1 putative iron-regulated membrane protein [Sphingomonas sp. BK235]
MRWLALLHRWVGALVGALLALLGSTGALLVWRDSLTWVPHAGDAPLRDPALVARLLAAAARSTRPVDRITLAGDGLGVHQLVYADGGGAYVSQTGAVVARWDGAWQRPELFVFDLHHRLLLGEAGEIANGVAALVGLFFVVSGVLLWWRSRARFRPRLWPARMSAGAIVHHHRDLGVLTAPLLALSLLTGAAMALPAVERTLLAPFGTPERPRPPHVPAAVPGAAAQDYGALLAQAAARFPGAALRRVQWPRRAGAPLVLRLRQPGEWTPNGRTFLYADPATRRIVGAQDPLRGGGYGRAREKLYPLHAAKVGGWAWKLAITASGIALALLGSLAVYGFWSTRAKAAAVRRRRRPVARALAPGA